MSNRFFITLLVLIAAIGGFIVVNKDKDSPSSGSSTTTQSTAHIKGSDKTGVVLVEYGDFQCPACRQYYPIVKQVYDKYKDQIQFQFRNFPLVQIHQHAFIASRAAEAASKQGKFWEMHDLLYENQQTWGSTGNPTTIFAQYATQLGLNAEQFKTDMASSEVNAIINADIKEAQKIGANSTPTFVLDGKKITNPTSVEDFEKVIDEAIKNKKTTGDQ